MLRAKRASSHIGYGDIAAAFKRRARELSAKAEGVVRLGGAVEHRGLVQRVHRHAMRVAMPVHMRVSSHQIVNEKKLKKKCGVGYDE